MEYLSEIVWGVWIAVGLGWELFCVLTEKRTGQEPLTRIVRDRLMRRFTVVKLGVAFFLFWWLIHWITPLEW